jgi:hypothetical protein
MRTILLAAIAVTALALPAFAGEGNGEPFPNHSNGTTIAVTSQRADRGSNAYPDVVGRPGSAVNLYAANVVPETGSQQSAETANSLPRGFVQDLPVYAQRIPAGPAAVAGNSIYLPRS